MMKRHCVFVILHQSVELSFAVANLGAGTLQPVQALCDYNLDVGVISEIESVLLNDLLSHHLQQPAVSGQDVKLCSSSSFRGDKVAGKLCFLCQSQDLP